MWIIQERKKVALWNKRHFEEKNGECAACLKYSVLIVVEKIYIKCNIWRAAVRPSYIEDARFLKVNACYVQGDSGGRINILLRDEIGHCGKKKVRMKTCVFINGYRNSAGWIYTYNSTVNDDKERNRITYFWLHFNYDLDFRWHICYSSQCTCYIPQ